MTTFKVTSVSFGITVDAAIDGGIYDFGDPAHLYVQRPGNRFTARTRASLAGCDDIKTASLDFSALDAQMRWSFASDGQYVRAVGTDYLYAPTKDGGVRQLLRMDSDTLAKITQLNDGKFTFRDFGKYRSGLCFITDDVSKILAPDTATGFDYNLPTKTLKVIRGCFYTSKKGSPCFRTGSDGQHILLMDPWGGSFNDYRGGNLSPKDALYYRRASSHGGGAGTDYAIYPYGWRNTIDIDDL